MRYELPTVFFVFLVPIHNVQDTRHQHTHPHASWMVPSRNQTWLAVKSINMDDCLYGDLMIFFGDLMGFDGDSSQKPPYLHGISQPWS